MVRRSKASPSSVNDEVISYSDVRNRAQLILLSFGGASRTTIRVKQAQQRAIEGLIEEKIQLKEFHKLSTDHDIGDDEIDEELEQMASPRTT